VRRRYIPPLGAVCWSCLQQSSVPFIAFLPFPVLVNVPIPGAETFKGWTVGDIIDFFFAPHLVMAMAGDEMFSATYVAYRDPVVAGCGYNITQPTMFSSGPGFSLEGMFTFNVAMEEVKMNLPNNHAYPSFDPNYGPNHPSNTGRGGNLIDEHFQVNLKPTITVGVNLDFALLGSGGKIEQTTTYDGLGPQPFKKYASEAIIVAPVVNPPSPSDN
jgi:hypothetical protein